MALGLRMGKERKTITLIGSLLVSSVVGGELSFYLSAGIPLLANDVGLSGAWGLSILMQFIYAVLSIAGFIIFMLLGRKNKLLTPNFLTVVFSAVLISVAINLFGVIYEGASIEFAWFSLIIVALSAISHAIITAAVNSLTRRLSGTREKASRAP